MTFIQRNSEALEGIIRSLRGVYGLILLLNEAVGLLAERDEMLEQRIARLEGEL